MVNACTMHGKPNATATEEIHTNPLAWSIGSTRSRTKWTKFFNRNLQINTNHRFINVHFKVFKYRTDYMIIQYNSYVFICCFIHHCHFHSNIIVGFILNKQIDKYPSCAARSVSTRSAVLVVPGLR